jgi:ATP synthase protein I
MKERLSSGLPREAASRERRFADAVASKEQRHLTARRERDQGVWFGLGMFGLVGWSVAIPTLLFLALGVWLDKQYPGRPSWTVTLLLVGVVIGCLNAWFWVKRESRHD